MQRVSFPLTYGGELIDGESTLGGMKITVADLYDAQSLFHSPTYVPLGVVPVGELRECCAQSCQLVRLHERLVGQ
jgi:hypothetical protein